MDIIEYRQWISEQETEKLRQVFYRLCEDQMRHYREYGNLDYMTSERQLSVETELRRRGEDPRDILSQVYDDELEYPPRVDE